MQSGFEVAYRNTVEKIICSVKRTDTCRKTTYYKECGNCHKDCILSVFSPLNKSGKSQKLLITR